MVVSNVRHYTSSTTREDIIGIGYFYFVISTVVVSVTTLSCNKAIYLKYNRKNHEDKN